MGEGRTHVDAGNGRIVRFSWDPRRLTGSVEERLLDDPLLRHSWGHRLTRLTRHADLRGRPAGGAASTPLRLPIERAAEDGDQGLTPGC